MDPDPYQNVKDPQHLCPALAGRLTWDKNQAQGLSTIYKYTSTVEE
jgi:hypothetical protein